MATTQKESLKELQERIRQLDAAVEIEQTKLDIEVANHEMTKLKLQREIARSSSSSSSSRKDRAKGNAEYQDTTVVGAGKHDDAESTAMTVASLKKEMERWRVVAESTEEREALVRRRFVQSEERRKQLEEELTELRATVALQDQELARLSAAPPSRLSSSSSSSSSSSFGAVDSKERRLGKERSERKIDVAEAADVEAGAADVVHVNEEVPLAVLAKMGDDPRQRAGRERAAASLAKRKTIRPRSRLDSYYGAAGVPDLPTRRVIVAKASASCASSSSSPSSSLSSSPPPPPQLTSSAQSELPANRRSGTTKEYSTKESFAKKSTVTHTSSWRGGAGKYSPSMSTGVYSPTSKSPKKIQKNLMLLEKRAKRSLARSSVKIGSATTRSSSDGKFHHVRPEGEVLWKERRRYSPEIKTVASVTGKGKGDGDGGRRKSPSSTSPSYSLLRERERWEGKREVNGATLRRKMEREKAARRTRVTTPERKTMLQKRSKSSTKKRVAKELKRVREERKKEQEEEKREREEEEEEQWKEGEREGKREGKREERVYQEDEDEDEDEDEVEDISLSSDDDFNGDDFEIEVVEEEEEEEKESSGDFTKTMTAAMLAGKTITLKEGKTSYQFTKDRKMSPKMPPPQSPGLLMDDDDDDDDDGEREEEEEHHVHNLLDGVHRDDEKKQTSSRSGNSSSTSAIRGVTLTSFEYSEVEMMLLEAEKLRTERKKKRTASTFPSSDFLEDGRREAEV